MNFVVLISSKQRQGVHKCENFADVIYRFPLAASVAALSEIFSLSLSQLVVCAAGKSCDFAVGGGGFMYCSGIDTF